MKKILILSLLSLMFSSCWSNITIVDAGKDKVYEMHKDSYRVDYIQIDYLFFAPVNKRVSYHNFSTKSGVDAFIKEAYKNESDWIVE
jgi:uncharacterized membrane protein